jgi:hypothetical protein
MNHSYFKSTLPLLILLFLALCLNAQTASVAADGAIAISDVKKEAISGKTYTSIFMIAGVVAIVGLAIYLSFSSDSEDKAAK